MKAVRDIVSAYRKGASDPSRSDIITKRKEAFDTVAAPEKSTARYDAQKARAEKRAANLATGSGRIRKDGGPTPAPMPVTTGSDANKDANPASALKASKLPKGKLK